MSNLLRIFNKIRNSENVIWAGAGFSKCAGIPLGSELVEIIKKKFTDEERDITNKITAIPEFAEEFVQLRNGSKKELLRIIRENIEINKPNYEELQNAWASIKVF